MLLPDSMRTQLVYTFVSAAEEEMLSWNISKEYSFSFVILSRVITSNPILLCNPTAILCKDET